MDGDSFIRTSFSALIKPITAKNSPSDNQDDANKKGKNQESPRFEPYLFIENGEILMNIRRKTSVWPIPRSSIYISRDKSFSNFEIQGFAILL